MDTDTFVKKATRFQYSLLNRLAGNRRFSGRFMAARRHRARITPVLIIAEEPFPGEEDSDEHLIFRQLLFDYLTARKPCVRDGNRILDLIEQRFAAIDRADEMLDAMKIPPPAERDCSNWHEEDWLRSHAPGQGTNGGGGVYRTSTVQDLYARWLVVLGNLPIYRQGSSAAPAIDFTRPRRYVAAALAEQEFPPDAQGLVFTKLQAFVSSHRTESRLNLHGVLPREEQEGYRPFWKRTVCAVSRLLKSIVPRGSSSLLSKS